METQNNKQQLILDAARKRFLHFGYAKTSLDEIANDIGMGKATLYHYYKNKEDIFLNVVKQESSYLRKLLLKSLAKVKTPHDKLKVFLQTHFDFLSGRVNIGNLTKERWRTLQPILDKGLREFYNEQIVLLRGILSEGIKDKSFRPIDPKQVSVLLLSMLRSFYVPGIVIDKSYSNKKMVHTFLNIVSNGIEA